MLTAMIFAKDHDRLVAFYREAFELTVDRAESRPGYTVLAGDAVRLAVHQVPDHIEATIDIAEPPEPRSSAAIKLIFGVADIDRSRDRLERLGASVFETTVDDALDGVDPEGNVLRLHTI